MELNLEKINEGKNFKLNYEGFEDFMIDDTPLTSVGGAHYVFKFPNGYGASVIKHLGSYGFSQDLWELAAIKFGTDLSEIQHKCDSWEIVHITELDLDIEGDLTDEEVRNLLHRIKEAS